LVEDVVDERDHPCSHSPHNPRHVLESEEKDDLPPPAMDVKDENEEEIPEEEEEDAEAELSLFS
jgi:hypothetical protein